MLKSFARHLNETVFRGPDNEGGSDVVENISDVGGDDDGGPSDTGDAEADSHVDEGEQKPLTVREQIKQSIEEVRAEDEGKGKVAKDPKSGRFQKKEAAAPAPKDGAPAATPAGTTPPATTAPPPASLTPEAKAAWEKGDVEGIKAAFIKREEDTSNGVEQLKQRYTLIDQAIAPHTDALRQMNATPADAVNRMFLWFKALAGNPAAAYPALAESMGIKWADLIAAKAGGAAAPGDPAAPVDPAAPGAAPEIPEPVKNYVGQLEQRLQQLQGMVSQIGGQFGNMQQTFQQQSALKTQENLSIWAKDKTHFEDVRVDMAKLIESGIVPVKPNGEVDLDTAYERAIHFNPEVRAKVYAEQQQANQQLQQQSKDAVTAAQQTQVGRARKAAVSIPASTTPGAEQRPTGTKKPGQKLSVRDSLKASIAQLRDQ